MGIKIPWFVLTMAGGNITTSMYVLPQPFASRPDESVSALFGQKAA
jgi:hypothetical protein